MQKEIRKKISYPVTSLNPFGNPLPTQEKFHKSNAKYRLLAGGFATGKTTSICIELIKDIAISDNYILLGRKDLQELKSTTLKELFDIIPPEAIVNHNKQDRVIKCVNGTEIYYTNLDASREAVEKIKSLNLGSCYIDQLEEIDEVLFLAIQGRLRRYNSRRNFVATCNPAGHDWIYHRWKIRPAKDYELFEAITLENIYLPEDYLEQLLSYPDKWVKRYVYCSWEDFEGLVYNEYIEAKHKCKLYYPADNERYYISIDYGFRNPTAIIYASVDYDGIVRIYNEYYERGKQVSEIANEIKSNRHWQKAIKLADPSMWNVQRDGLSIADEFASNGIVLIQANNSVIQGIDKVNQYFKDNRLFVAENCVNWMLEQGNYKWKEIKPGQQRNEYEEPIKRNDHLQDATRYLINHIYSPDAPKKKVIIPAGTDISIPATSELDYSQY